VTPLPQLLGGNQIAAPKNRAELEAISERRDELREQLQSLNDRRRELADQVARTGTDDPVVRAGPVARLKALDARIGLMEADIERSDRLITEAMAKGIANDRMPGMPEVHVINPPPAMEAPPSLPGPGFIWTSEVPWQDRLGATLATTLPITLATVVLLGALLYWRVSRSVRNQLNKIQATQTGALLELQRSVDAIAVEVERVSENQRFVTRLVGEKPPAQVPERR
jgi:hypothetical protein